MSRSPPSSTAGESSADVRRLHAQIDKLCNILADELEKIRGEQQRARALIAHAARELYGNFMRMNESVERSAARTDQLFERLIHGDAEVLDRALVGDMQSKHLADRDSFKRANAAAIKALQFEDISAQALAGCLQTLEFLDRLLQSVQQTHDPEAIEQLVDQLLRHWKAHQRNPDRQDSIEEGSVELF
ncbi:MAG: hypothetical protein RQ729_05085 [Wenzhouxiangellaceae bacterium]|nr:hypothetical protein [Wenzhouxiangellaceae bacterium]